MKNSIKWECTFGISPGYQSYEVSENEQYLNSMIPNMDDVAKIIQRNQLWLFEATGVYVSCVFYQSRTMYHPDWGCPETGEHTVTLTGCCNPTFVDPAAYIEALKRFINYMQKDLNQTTVQLEIWDISHEYYRD